MHVLFDLNGTLLDAGALTDAWPGGRGAGLRVLDDAVWQAQVDTLTGEWRPFPEYLRAALTRAALAVGAGDDLVEAGMAAARALPPFPDARDALTAVRTAGHSPVVLTNSAADAARAALDAAGLEVDAVISCDAVGRYKPHPQTYAHALAELRAQGEAWFVAAHWWDVLGAKRAGLRTGWVGRDEGALLTTVPAPDVAGASLLDVAARLPAA